MTHFLPILAEGYKYQPFVKAAPIWDYWYLLLIPLCLGISIVYKSVRCATMREVPRQALSLLAFIIVALAASAAALAGLVTYLERP